MENNLHQLSKTAVLQGVDNALKDYTIAAFKKEVLSYDLISAAQDIEFHYTPTILSPKKFFFPPEETLLDYQNDGEMTVKTNAKPLVLFGIRPCDLNGIKILDEAFAERHGDPNYLSKREKAIVIGLDCKTLCDRHAFCDRVASQEAKGGFDIMLYESGENYLVQIASERGKKFLDVYFALSKTEANAWDHYQKEKTKSFQPSKPFKKLAQFPSLFEANKEHPVWKQEGDRCLSCGSCIMVCPTCYCFDIEDELKLNLKQGSRLRKWDACMLSDFAAVAGGENFRHSVTERLKHRINRKFNYLMKKHGQSVCVGCGRCVRACLAEISPKKIAETIADEKE